MGIFGCFGSRPAETRIRTRAEGLEAGGARGGALEWRDTSRASAAANVRDVSNQASEKRECVTTPPSMHLNAYLLHQSPNFA